MERGLLNLLVLVKTKKKKKKKRTDVQKLFELKIKEKKGGYAKTTTTAKKTQPLLKLKKRKKIDAQKLFEVDKEETHKSCRN